MSEPKRREPAWPWGSKCVECGTAIPAGTMQKCEKGGWCSWHVPIAVGDRVRELAEQRRELLEALKNEVSKQNCICKFLPFTGGAPPCNTCKLNDVIRRAEGR